MPEASRTSRASGAAYAGAYRTTLNWKLAWPNTTIRRTQTGSSDSVPRAVVMSPRSMMSRQPNHSASRRLTSAFAAASFPLTKIVWSPPASAPG